MDPEPRRRLENYICADKPAQLVQFYRMNKVEILDQIPNLTPEERNEIRRKLDKLDELDGNQWSNADAPLTSEEKALLDARIADTEARPETSIPWAETESRLKARFGE